MTGKWDMTNAGSGAAGAGGSSLADEVRGGDVRKWGPRLKGMLEAQRSVCLRLDEMSLVQQGLVRSGDTAAVLGVLAERQGMVEELQRISAELEPFRARRQELMARLGETERAVYERLVEEISGLVEGVKTRDDQDRVEMERQRGEVTSELTGMYPARGAVAAYGGAGRSGSQGATVHDRNG